MYKSRPFTHADLAVTSFASKSTHVNINSYPSKYYIIIIVLWLKSLIVLFNDDTWHYAEREFIPTLSEETNLHLLSFNVSNSFDFYTDLIAWYIVRETN